ncbi:putative transcriptional regulator, LuxR family protein [Saccharopolyspora subtropica]|uniref:Response regulator transcription factor n=1 Tax=Saccharopolyspora thermophila TaxID=89367 RepID=A0A917JSV1_9PSEU|nr:response regulator transcription factor [Saccharopolyspora subtropica]GGI84466.1 putative transcriptional regulator, LuxR family protein [Saccharopolyspora subtropica]
MDRSRPAGTIRVFLVDDHELVRVGLADLLDAEDDLEVVGQAGSVAEALARIPAVRPDVAALDVRLPDGNGVELCRELRSRIPDLRCLMLTSFTDAQAKLDAVLAGAAGYLVKDVRGMELSQAVRLVGSGRTLFGEKDPAALVERLRADLDSSADLPNLTRQERVLLDLVGEGLTNREIAERMFLAEKTVKNYVSRLLAKLGVQRRTQAAVIATRARRQR